MDNRREFPKGCYVGNIHRGVGERDIFVYACLYDKEGNLIIGSDLEYIYEQLNNAIFV